MKHKPMRLLLCGLIGVAVLCVVVISVVSNHMRGESVQAIRYIGESYMSSMSQQVTLHLGATLQLRMNQVDTIAGECQEMTAGQLKAAARAREFDYLALYQPGQPSEQALYPILGSQLVPDDGEKLWQYLDAGESRIAMGKDKLGGRVILMSVPGSFTIGGRTGTALVAGVWASYIDENLRHELDEGMVASYAVIRADGSLINRSLGSHPIEGTNFFAGLKDVVDSDDPEGFVAGLKEAMSRGEDCSFQISSKDEPIHVYCGDIPDSDWYLLLYTSYGTVNSGVDALGNKWTSTAFSGCAVILLAMLGVFFWYIAVTRRQMRDLDEARRVAEGASRAKSQFLSNMSHDIRTPLNAIVGMTAIAKNNLDSRESITKCLNTITYSSRHLLGLINDILDMAKIDSGGMTLNTEQASLREIMQEMVSIVQQQVKLKQQNFDVYIDNISVEDVCCDSVRLHQIFLNLLSNAIKFTPEGGTIRVSLYESPSPKGDGFIRVHLQVKDNGVGMSEEFVSHIFESFVREDNARVNKAQGAGVGMAITKHIVDAMEGAIRVKSKPGEGTEVNVVLDLEKAKVAERDMRLPNWPMLVVDDDETLCASAAATLKSLGVHADWTTKPSEALRMTKERKEKGKAYQLFLLDWRLPGTDGVRLASELREITGDEACFLLTSAYDKDDMREAAKASHIKGAIAKPLFKSTLYYGLLEYMGGEHQVPPQKQDEPDFTGRRVIIAEDNDLNWEVAEELLSELGLELVRAEDGRVCVEMFKKSAPGEYDAILMDLRMPEMSGYEAAQAIRAMKRPDAKLLPIIAMSADAFPEDVQKCLDCGMNAHSAKPIDVSAIAILLGRYMQPKKQ